MIYDLLISAEVVGVLKQNYNKFMIYYTHPTKESKDVCIVIGIDDFKNISIITNFTKNRNYRVRE